MSTRSEAETVSYLGLMRAYATARGLTRMIVPVPAFLPPGSDVVQGLLEAAAPERLTLWLRLLESLRNETSMRDDSAQRDFPGVQPRGVEDALRDALAESAAA